MKKLSLQKPYQILQRANIRVNQKELQRLHLLTEFERAARLQGFANVAGIDEAGRGPLAGPVVAAVCLIPENFYIAEVDDSKKMQPQVRKELFHKLISDRQIKYGVGIIPNDKIDEVNIYQATIMAMLQAVVNLSSEPEFLLVDGLHLPHPKIPTQKIIQGDQKSQSIAAASIIAKETRDQLMLQYHSEYPQYGFANHKGYGTPEHLEALGKHGPCPIHRHSFEPVRSAMA